MVNPFKSMTLYKLYAMYHIKENHSLRHYTQAMDWQMLSKNPMHKFLKDGGQEQKDLARQIV